MTLNNRAVGLLLILCAAACGRPEPSPESQVKIDIQIPQDDINPDDISRVLNAADGFVVEGVQEIDIRALAAKVEVSGDFKPVFDNLIASRDPIATLECRSRKCKLVSTGRDFSFKAEGITVPVIGTPTLMLTKKIDVYFELTENRNRLEACRIDGLKVKAGLFVQNVEGALVEVEDLDEAGGPALLGTEEVGEDPEKPESSKRIKNLKVDAGTGGSYPSTACMSSGT